MTIVPIIYFSDVLCVWAHIAQVRLAAVKAAFGDQVRLEPRFCSVFGDSARKIATNWGARGGYGGFNAHLMESAAQFPEVTVHPDIWLTVRPASSSGAHLFLKAIAVAEAATRLPQGSCESATLALRRAFFHDARDIAAWAVQRAVAVETGLPLTPIEAAIHDGSAFAALATDHQDAEAMDVRGSPSFVLNSGRQKLYGNVGYRILEANIQELLRKPTADQASWC